MGRKGGRTETMLMGVQTGQTNGGCNSDRKADSRGSGVWSRDTNGPDWFVRNGYPESLPEHVQNSDGGDLQKTRADRGNEENDERTTLNDGVRYKDFYGKEPTVLVGQRLPGGMPILVHWVQLGTQRSTLVTDERTRESGRYRVPAAHDNTVTEKTEVERPEPMPYIEDIGIRRRHHGLQSNVQDERHRSKSGRDFSASRMDGSPRKNGEDHVQRQQGSDSCRLCSAPTSGRRVDITRRNVALRHNQEDRSREVDMEKIAPSNAENGTFNDVQRSCDKSISLFVPSVQYRSSISHLQGHRQNAKIHQPDHSWGRVQKKPWRNARYGRKVHPNGLATLARPGGCRSVHSEETAELHRPPGAEGNGENRESSPWMLPQRVQCNEQNDNGEAVLAENPSGDGKDDHSGIHVVNGLGGCCQKQDTMGSVIRKSCGRLQEETRLRHMGNETFCRKSSQESTGASGERRGFSGQPGTVREMWLLLPFERICGTQQIVRWYTEGTRQTNMPILQQDLHWELSQDTRGELPLETGSKPQDVEEGGETSGGASANVNGTGPSGRNFLGTMWGWRMALDNIMQPSLPLLQEKACDDTIWQISSDYVQSGSVQPLVGILTLSEEYFANKDYGSREEPLDIPLLKLWTLLE